MISADDIFFTSNCQPITFSETYFRRTVDNFPIGLVDSEFMNGNFGNFSDNGEVPTTSNSVRPRSRRRSRNILRVPIQKKTNEPSPGPPNHGAQHGNQEETPKQGLAVASGDQALARRIS